LKIKELEQQKKELTQMVDQLQSNIAEQTTAEDELTAGLINDLKAQLLTKTTNLLKSHHTTQTQATTLGNEITGLRFELTMKAKELRQLENAFESLKQQYHEEKRECYILRARLVESSSKIASMHLTLDSLRLQLQESDIRLASNQPELDKLLRHISQLTKTIRVGTLEYALLLNQYEKVSEMLAASEKRHHQRKCSAHPTESLHTINQMERDRTINERLQLSQRQVQELRVWTRQLTEQGADQLAEILELQSNVEVLSRNSSVTASDSTPVGSILDEPVHSDAVSTADHKFRLKHLCTACGTCLKALENTIQATPALHTDLQRMLDSIDCQSLSTDDITRDIASGASKKELRQHLALLQASNIKYQQRYKREKSKRLEIFEDVSNLLQVVDQECKENVAFKKRMKAFMGKSTLSEMKERYHLDYLRADQHLPFTSPLCSPDGSLSDKPFPLYAAFVHLQQLYHSICKEHQGLLLQHQNMTAKFDQLRQKILLRANAMTILAEVECSTGIMPREFDELPDFVKDFALKCTSSNAMASKTVKDDSTQTQEPAQSVSGTAKFEQVPELNCKPQRDSRKSRIACNEGFLDQVQQATQVHSFTKRISGPLFTLPSPNASSQLEHVPSKEPRPAPEPVLPEHGISHTSLQHNLSSTFVPSSIARTGTFDSIATENSKLIKSTPVFPTTRYCHQPQSATSNQLPLNSIAVPSLNTSTKPIIRDDAMMTEKVKSTTVSPSLSQSQFPTSLFHSTTNVSVSSSNSYAELFPFTSAARSVIQTEKSAPSKIELFNPTASKSRSTPSFIPLRRTTETSHSDSRMYANPFSNVINTEAVEPKLSEPFGLQRFNPAPLELRSMVTSSTALTVNSASEKETSQRVNARTSRQTSSSIASEENTSETAAYKSKKVEKRRIRKDDEDSTVIECHAVKRGKFDDELSSKTTKKIKPEGAGDRTRLRSGEEQDDALPATSANDHQLDPDIGLSNCLTPLSIIVHRDRYMVESIENH
jgi:hypothetical protein